jgi:hypothetical protein
VSAGPWICEWHDCKREFSSEPGLKHHQTSAGHARNATGGGGLMEQAEPRGQVTPELGVIKPLTQPPAEPRSPLIAAPRPPAGSTKRLLELEPVDVTVLLEILGGEEGLDGLRDHTLDDLRALYRRVGLLIRLRELSKDPA